MLDENKQLVSAVDFYFIEEDGVQSHNEIQTLLLCGSEEGQYCAWLWIWRHFYVTVPLCCQLSIDIPGSLRPFMSVSLGIDKLTYSS